MNTHFTVDLERIPTTLDLFHVGLAAAVLLLAFILVILLLMMVISLGRRLKKASQPIVAVEIPEPEVKIVEKIIEVEKVVTVEKIVEIPAATPEPVVLKEATPDAALQLLSLLQKEARFLDFVKENVEVYNDADVGAAARVVHSGCVKVVDEYFSLESIRTEDEESKITVSEGFNAAEIRLTGNIVGKAPFTGTLVHKGWKVTNMRLPKLTQGHDAQIIAAAEVEL